MTTTNSYWQKLKLTTTDYKNIAENISRMKNIPLWQREEILDKANSEIDPETSRLAKQLIKDLAYDKEIYKIAGLSYAQGPPKGEGLFTTAVADYFLRKNIRMN